MRVESIISVLVAHLVDLLVVQLVDFIEGHLPVHYH